MTTPILTKSFRVGAADIAGFLIAAASGTGDLLRVATGATDSLIGAADEMGGKANGMVDIDVAGWSSVRYGATVAFNDPLTADAQGRAVKAVPVAGSIVQVIGFARCDADEGDIGAYEIARSLIATPAAGG